MALHQGVTLVAFNATAHGSLRHHLTVGVHPTSVTQVLAFVFYTELIRTAVGVADAFRPDRDGVGRDTGGSVGHFLAPNGGNALVPFGTPTDGSVANHLAVGVHSTLVTEALTFTCTTRFVSTTVGVFEALYPSGRRSDHNGSDYGDFVTLYSGVTFVAFDAATDGPMSDHSAVGVDPALATRVETLALLAGEIRLAVGVFVAFGRWCSGWRRFEGGSAGDWMAPYPGIASVSLATGAHCPVEDHLALGVDAAFGARVLARAADTGSVTGTAGIVGTLGRRLGRTGGV